MRRARLQRGQKGHGPVEDSPKCSSRDGQWPPSLPDSLTGPSTASRVPAHIWASPPPSSLPAHRPWAEGLTAGAELGPPPAGPQRWPPALAPPAPCAEPHAAQLSPEELLQPCAGEHPPNLHECGSAAERSSHTGHLHHRCPQQRPHRRGPCPLGQEPQASGRL